MTHTCHTPYCWLLSCAVCASCEACAEAYRARRPTLPDDASAEVRQAVELLRETPVGEDPALDAHWTEARERIAAKVGASVAATEARMNAPVKTRRYPRFEVSVHAAERYRERIDPRVNRPTATGILARILESGFVCMGCREGADLYRDPRRPMRLEVVVVGRVVVTVFDPIEQTGEVGREMVIALAALERAHGHGGQGPAETPGPSERPCAPSSAATEGAC